jgi:hypothetical protein
MKLTGMSQIASNHKTSVSEGYWAASNIVHRGECKLTLVAELLTTSITVVRFLNSHNALTLKYVVLCLQKLTCFSVQDLEYVLHHLYHISYQLTITCDCCVLTHFSPPHFTRMFVVREYMSRYSGELGYYVK